MSDIYIIKLTTNDVSVYTGKMSRPHTELVNGFVLLGTLTIEGMVRQGKPIYLTDHGIDVMDRQTKKDILAHNKAWKSNCQKETSSSQ
ncbi:hypothetical protein ACRZTK_001090 [Enterobacter asburiae]